MVKGNKSLFSRQRNRNQAIQAALGVVITSGLILSSYLLLRRFNLLPSQMDLPQLSLINWDEPNAAVWALAYQAPAQRRSQLQSLAQSRKSADMLRARYLLAVDYLAEGQPKAALAQLEGLERDYTLLAPQILWYQAKAHELLGDRPKAQQLHQAIVKNYPGNPLIVEALLQLNQIDPAYGDQAIAKFPAQPRTRELINQRLAAKPKDMQLLLLLATYYPDSKQTNEIRDRLVKEHSEHLSLEHWEMLANSYWEAGQYNQAADAYAKLPRTPLHLYCYARGKQLANRNPEAKSGYLELVSAFPDAQESAIAMRRLSGLTSAQIALSYLDIVINKFPQEAPAALATKVDILEEQQDSAAATKARQILLSKYPKSQVAAGVQWRTAQRLALRGNTVEAWAIAQAITQNNPDSEYAPEAAFWIGKWAKQMGRNQEAETSFRYVIKNYPESYYAWRSAVFLGWDVGDFTNIWQRQPALQLPKTRAVLPAGSPLVKELYRLGEYQLAWQVWRSQLKDPNKLSVAEQFTDGLLRQGIGDNLNGINQIWTLSSRENEEKKQWQQLRQQPMYWHGLFPFPFKEEIFKNSQALQLNPLLVMSLIRQESRFETQIVSSAGAIGLMQVMPETGKSVANSLKMAEFDLKNYQDNIRIGTWYLDANHRTYEGHTMLAVASYNAGAGNVASWLDRFGLEDVDTFVERIPFRETKDYVKSVMGNYWNYLRLYNPDLATKINQLHTP